MPLTAEQRRTLSVLCDELASAANELVGACRKDDWSAVENLVPKVKSYVRSIKEEIASGVAKSQLRQLDQHAQFVEVYAKKKNLRYVLSNAHSIRPDLQRLRSALGLGGKDELREAIEALPAGKERELLEEAVRCLEAESPHGLVE